MKYDVDRREIVGKIEYINDGAFGSYQAVYVPNEREDIDAVKAEDDGYLVNIIWNEQTKKSNLQVPPPCISGFDGESAFKTDIRRKDNESSADGSH